MTERERRIHDVAFATAFATYHTTDEYRGVLERKENDAPWFEERAARYAEFLAFRAVESFRRSQGTKGSDDDG